MTVTRSGVVERAKHLRFVLFGRSISSGPSTGHASVYRGLVRELARRGHDVLFLERSPGEGHVVHEPPELPYGTVAHYVSLQDLEEQWTVHVREADVVLLGSSVPEGARLGAWVTTTARGAVAFYDLETPVTLAMLARRACPCLSPDVVPKLDAYLTTTGGPMLDRIRHEIGAARVHTLYPAADGADEPLARTYPRWDLGFLGVYSQALQAKLERLIVQPARWSPDRRFVVAGAVHDADDWPRNVERVAHVALDEHRAFYRAQRFTVEASQPWMPRFGHSPTTHLFEAAASGTPILSEGWPGLETFFVPGREILIARSAGEVLELLDMSDAEREAIAELARERVLSEHTPANRAEQLERLALEWLDAKRSPSRDRQPAARGGTPSHSRVVLTAYGRPSA